MVRSLASRVAAACGASTLVVLAAFGVVLHHRLRASIVGWERSNFAAVGHHVAEMVAALPPEQRAERVTELGGDLEAFGLGIELAPESGAPSGGIEVPLDDAGAAVRVTATRDGARSLVRRLAPVYLGLTVAVFAALLAAIQLSVYWGLVRPLRSVRRGMSVPAHRSEAAGPLDGKLRLRPRPLLAFPG